MEFKKVLKKLSEAKKLASGYYVGGIILSLAFFILKITNGVCNVVFNMEGECGLDHREHEIMVFLAIIVFYKNRKAANWMHCLANMFMFCKLANIYLFVRADLITGVIYIFMCLSKLCLAFFNFSPQDEIQRNTRITWIIFFYTAWSPDCKHVSPVFAELSDRFNLPNLRFAKLDVGRWSQEANRFRINAHPTSRQLPTISLFKEGKEVQRRPIVRNRRAVPFTFSKENCVLAFDLNNLYEKCKLNMTKSEKVQIKNEGSTKGN
ncbi:unnamed protein product [Thelazia callipaeda]|uniref:Thioredoxin domain-containing protein n=1 Tax=Thelazia callipaeda TaxID=103827 RepID=A0A0N5CWZ6_THECL|nr:unnamed protein product [Thelazia callipaeda]